ncbi:hypothetical protein POM88_018365 [Heracleum sosnowskyi]|uniref:Uncharacterized protein n=1 Tax=Heracleum sosnowskyi TaxID=360622 RepID=A0AAD8IQE2_9APIA|nr:hypothetical protein POM88_018365 [Heracleum sosnowskyi]
MIKLMFMRTRQISNSLVYTKIKRYEIDELVKRRSYTHKKDIVTQCIKEGDIINLSDLLFTKNRDYLVKYNNERVPFCQLSGKRYWDYFENKGKIYSYKNEHTYDYDSRGPGVNGDYINEFVVNYPISVFGLYF